MSSAGGRTHRPRILIEGIRLKKYDQVSGQALIAALDPRESYRLLDHAGKLLRMADSRQAQVLIMRGLIGGEMNGAGTLVNLRLAPGRTAAQVRAVMRLKPAAVSICNRATVVKVLPTTYTHRDSLRAGF